MLDSVAKDSLDKLNYRQWKETRRTIGHAAELWIVVSISVSRNAQCGLVGCMRRRVLHVGFFVRKTYRSANRTT
jgi:hypothetical protein